MFSFCTVEFPSFRYQDKVGDSTSASSEDLKNVVRHIASAERSLVQAEDMVRQLNVIRAEKTGNMEYEMKNKVAVLEHRFVDLGQLVEHLYRFRRSLKARAFAVVENTYRELIGLYRSTWFPVTAKKRFPSSGVFVDLDRGKCARLFHRLVLPAEFWSSAALESIIGCTDSCINCFLAEDVDLLIHALENYESTLESCDSTVGIYNRKVFEEAHAALWVKTEAKDDSVGHYEVRNRIAKAKRHFVDLSCVISILYDWRITIGRMLDEHYIRNDYDSRNVMEESNHFDKLQYLFNNSMFPLGDANSRFPAEGVYIDLTNGACSVLLIKIMEYLHAEMIPPFEAIDEILHLLDNYECYWDDPESGMYDRAHFEHHFSATWVAY